MNIKKVTKIISIILVVMTILSAFSMVFATSGPSIPTPSDVTGSSDISNIAGGVIYVIQIIAFAAAVIMLIFVGIKFITASPEAKAEIKKTAVIYIVGAILLFGASGVLALIQTLAGNVSA